jgi:hypothetical protein
MPTGHDSQLIFKFRFGYGGFLFGGQLKGAPHRAYETGNDRNAVRRTCKLLLWQENVVSRWRLTQEMAQG